MRKVYIMFVVGRAERSGFSQCGAPEVPVAAADLPQRTHRVTQQPRAVVARQELEHVVDGAGAAQAQQGAKHHRVDGEELVRHIEQVVAGETVVDTTLAGRLAASAARLQRGEFWPGAHLGLTQRESEVLALLVSGLSNRAIAQRLVLGEETVKSHLRGLYRKLEVPDRSAAIAVALREGLFR